MVRLRSLAVNKQGWIMRRLMEFVSRNKKAAATIWSAFVAISVIVTILSGFPAAMENAATYLPSFASTPNARWVAGIFIVWLIVMRWIWRQPDDSQKHDKWLTEAIEGIKGGTIREYRLLELLANITGFQKAMYDVPGKTLSQEYILNMLEVMYPARLTDLFEDKVRDKYLAVLTEAKQKSRNAFIMAEAAIPIMEDAILRGMNEEEFRRKAPAQTEQEQAAIATVLKIPANQTNPPATQ